MNSIIRICIISIWILVINPIAMSQETKLSKREILENPQVTSLKNEIKKGSIGSNDITSISKYLKIRNRNFGSDNINLKKANEKKIPNIDSLAEGRRKKRMEISPNAENICNLPDDYLFQSGYYVQDPQIVIDPQNPDNITISFINVEFYSSLQESKRSASISSLNNGMTFPYNWSYLDITDFGEFHSSPAYGPTGSLYNSVHVERSSYGGSPWNSISVRKSLNKGINWVSGSAGVYYAQDPDLLQGNNLSIDYNSSSPYYGDFYDASSYVYFINNIGWIPYVNFSYCAAIDDAFDWIPSIQVATNPSADPVLETGINGEVFLAWSDFGTNYPNDDYQIGFSRLDVGSNTFNTPTYINIRPVESLSSSVFNQMKIYSYPVLAVDKSNGPHRGRLYLAISAEFSNRSTIQVFFSDDNGTTWSTPNDVDLSFSQAFNPWISVDKITGEVNVAYYANISHYPNTFSFNVFLSSSTDGMHFTTGEVGDFGFLMEDESHYDGNGVFIDLSNPGRVGLASYNGQSYVCWRDNGLQFSKAYNNVLNQPHVLQGPDSFCGSATYSISNFVSGSQITWGAYPSNMVSITNNNDGTATVNQIGHGIISIGAWLEDGCNRYRPDKLVSVGNGLSGTYLTPEGYSMPFSNSNLTTNGLTQVFLNVENDPNATIRWRLISGGPLTWWTNNFGHNLNMNLSDGSVTFRATITSICGISTSEHTFTATGWARGIESVNTPLSNNNTAKGLKTQSEKSRNHSEESITEVPTAAPWTSVEQSGRTIIIKYNNSQDVQNGGKSPNGIKHVNLYDLSGRLLKSWTFSGVRNQEKIEIPTNTTGMVIFQIIYQSGQISKMAMVK